MFFFSPSTSTCISPEAVGELREKQLDFQTFTDLERSVVTNVEFLRASKLVPDDVAISGWVYDVKTGRTTRVV